MIVYKFISILSIVAGSDNLEKPNSNIGVKRSLCNSGVSNVDDESGLTKKLRISDDFCQNDKFDSESVSQNNNESFGLDNNVGVPEKLFCNQRIQATTSCSNSSTSDVFSFKNHIMLPLFIIKRSSQEAIQNFMMTCIGILYWLILSAFLIKWMKEKTFANLK
ncbi:hypothetical protein H311_02999 [Anncaliia algerae PRA109]|nr:hypothetical protein H311_02999 [Anncaliia algerae PRA109]